MINSPDFTDRPITDRPIPENGIIIARDSDGILSTNVPHLVVQHSPTGFECGYGGSGPADLALNIAEYVLRGIDFQGHTERAFNGHYFLSSFSMHQALKWEFIARLKLDPGESATLELEKIAGWINDWLKNHPNIYEGI